MQLHGSYTRGGPADNSTPLEWQKMAIELKRWRFHEDRTADKNSVPATHGFSSVTGRAVNGRQRSLVIEDEIFTPIEFKSV